MAIAIFALDRAPTPSNATRTHGSRPRLPPAIRHPQWPDKRLGHSPHMTDSSPTNVKAVSKIDPWLLFVELSRSLPKITMYRLWSSGTRSCSTSPKDNYLIPIDHVQAMLCYRAHRLCRQLAKCTDYGFQKGTDYGVLSNLDRTPKAVRHAQLLVFMGGAIYGVHRST